MQRIVNRRGLTGKRRLIVVVSVDLDAFDALLVGNGGRLWTLLNEEQRRQVVQDGLDANNDLFDCATIVRFGEEN